MRTSLLEITSLYDACVKKEADDLKCWNKNSIIGDIPLRDFKQRLAHEAFKIHLIMKIFSP